MMKQIDRTDISVVGGGPAGLAAAIAARLAGFDVVLIDRQQPPIDKPCGEGIMPDGAALLDQLGVDLPGTGAIPLRGIDLVGDGVRARGDFPGRPGLGIPRPALHGALVHRAEQLGIELLWGREVRRLTPSGLLLDDGEVRSRWIIAADGLNSPTRRALQLDREPLHRRFGIRCHFDRPPWSDRVEVHFTDGCEAYVTPVGQSTVGLAVLIHDPGLRFDQALSLFPALARRLQDVPRLDDPQGASTVYRRLPHVTRGAVALLGDAAGSVDAITGDGITLALHQAKILARCLRAGDLGPYETACLRLMRFPGALTRFMLATAQRRRLRTLTLRVLAATPWVLSQILSMHARTHPLTRQQSDKLPFLQEITGRPGSEPLPPRCPRSR